MELLISIPDWVIDFFVLYLCLGSVVLFPWSIYRATGLRNKLYWEALSFKGCWLFIAVWVLWPRCIYVMYKGR